MFRILAQNLDEDIKMRNIKKMSMEYNSISSNLNDFKNNLNKIVEINLNLWLEIAKLNNLSLSPVVIQEGLEVTAFESKFESKKIEVPEFGEVTFSNKKGTVVFVDISRSTDFFKENSNSIKYTKNYTGFVIFNSYISLVKRYVRLSKGEFLEHTGDGSLIFYENNDLIKSYNECKNLKTHPLCMMFYIGYKLQYTAKEKELLKFYDNSSIYSLVHIGAAYGDVLDVNLGDMRKFVSDVVWKAANNCKGASREFKKDNNGFIELPIEV